jgi:hypothetical protein
MSWAIRFYTEKFDVTKERPNPINPIPGESLLSWLKTQVPKNLEIQDPEPEDWGWFSSVNWKGRTYMLGSSAAEEEDWGREWVLQIVKHRSILEKLLGRAKMTEDDECALFFKHLLESESAVRNISVDL